MCHVDGKTFEDIIVTEVSQPQEKTQTAWFHLKCGADCSWIPGNKVEL